MTYAFIDVKKNKISQLNSFSPIYTLKIEYFSYQQAKKEFLEEKTKLKKDNSAVIIDPKKLNDQLPQFIRELKQEVDLVIGHGGLNKTNRFLLEKTQIDYIMDPHSSKDKLKKDFIHHFNSGINHVLATQAKEKNIGLFISMHQFQQKKKNLAKDIGRIQQNIKLAKKYNLPILINYIAQKPTQMKTQQEIHYILLFLGATTQQASQSLKHLENKLKENKFKNSSQYIAKGLHITNC